jgi:ABC-2 type transport system permease protein
MSEFLAVYWRDMRKFTRFTMLLVSALMQPILWLVLFGVSMSSSLQSMMPSTGLGTTVDYLTFMAPGVIAQTILFTCLYGGITLQFDRMQGTLKQMFASPMTRSSIPVGLTLTGVVKSVLQVAIMTVFGLLIGVAFFRGFTPGQTALSLLGMLAFVVLFAVGLMLLSCAISVGLTNHESVQNVITLLTVPLLFLSNAFYPIENLPTILKLLSQANPVTYFMNGVRYFTIGAEFTSFSTAYSFTFNDILLAAAYLLLFDALIYALTLRVFAKAKVI